MACRKSTDLLLPKNSLSNVKIIFLQPLVESNNNNNNNNNNINKKNLSDNNMSLNTLLEAAKFLEMQEEIQHRATLDSSTARSTAICPIIATNGGSNHLTNGTNEIQQPQQKFSIQPVTILSSSSATTTTNSNNNNNNNNNLLSHQNNVHSHNSPQQQQTVVISNNNISSTFVPNIHGPISFATATPTTLTGSAISVSSQIILPNNGNKKEQDGHISSTTTQGQKRIMNNSFDIMNPLIIDESGPTESKKLKQPPMVFRSGTREVHNKLEKCRRAHLKECFDLLKKQLPSNGDEKKTSNLSILHSALKYIQLLKRRETEYEHQLERLAREKITNQQRLASLKKDCHFDGMDFSKLLPEIPSSTTTSITQQQQQQQQQQKKFKRDSGDGLLIPTSPTSSLSPKNSYTLMADSLLIKHNSADNNLLIKNDDFYNAELSDETSSATVGSVDSSTGIVVNDSTIISSVISQTNSVITSTNGEINKISIPSSSVLGKTIPIVTSTNNNNNNNNNNNQPSTKEISQASAVQTTGISVLPMPYQVNQGLVLQKVAIVPHKGLTDLAPLVPTHFITTPQQLNGINGQINGKVVPLTQYIVKPMVVVSTANPPVRNGS